MSENRNHKLYYLTSYTCSRYIHVHIYCFFFKRFYLPGWTTLTWSSLNIDPYLHLLEMSTKLLQSSIERCNDVLSSRVYPLINDITHIKLINIDLATSKVWVSNDIHLLCVYCTCTTCMHRILIKFNM